MKSRELVQGLDGEFNFSSEVTYLSPRQRFNLRRREARAALAPSTAEAVIACMQQGKPIRWEHVEWEEAGLLIQLASEELQIPTSMLSQPDFHQPLHSLPGNRTLIGLYRYVQNHPERTGRDTMSFLLEKIGVSVTEDDLIRHIGRGGKVMWSRVPPEAKRPLLEKIAEELGQPVSMLGREELYRPLNLLKGRDAGGIYGNAYQNPQREGKDTILFLLEECGITSTADDVIKRMQSGHEVFWDRVAWEEVGDLLTIVAEELQRPVTALKSVDLRTPLKFLGNRTLGGFIDYLRHNGESVGIADILEKAGLSMTVDDAIAHVKSGNLFFWRRIPWTVTSRLLEMAAEELGLPVSMLAPTQLDRPFAFLGNRSLLGLYQFLRKHSERNDQDTILFMFEKAKINIATEDIIERMRQGLAINWNRIPVEAMSKLLSMAAEEAGLPPAAVGSAELYRPLSFLNNHSLIGIYNFYRTHPERGDRDTLPFLLEKLGITISANEVIARAKADRPISWDRVPWAEIGKILQAVAVDLGVPASMLTQRDIKRTPLSSLDGIKFGGLYEYATNHPLRRNGQEIMGFIFEQAAIKSVTSDVVQSISMERRINWDRVSWPVIKELFNLVSQETGLPVFMLTNHHLSQRFKFLGDHTLNGLYHYYLHHPEKSAYETTLAFIRRSTGLPAYVSALTRAYYRLVQIQESFNSQVLGATDGESLSLEGLLPWINSVSRLYQKAVATLERDDFQSELAIIVSEELNRSAAKTTNFVQNVHKRLEQIVREEYRIIYRQKSLETNIGGEGLTLEGVIGRTDPSLDAVESGGIELNSELKRRLAKLLPLQRKLLYEITVEEKSFEELETETGIDIEVLKEHYDDALALLREETETSEDSEEDF